MRVRLLSALAVVLELRAYADTARVEVAPELSAGGSATFASAAMGAVSLQLTADALIPAVSCDAAALIAMPAARVALQPAAANAILAGDRPEAAWEFLNLVIVGKGALVPAAAWPCVVGAK